MKHLLIVGAGNGLSRALAQTFKAVGYTVALAARNTTKLTEIAEQLDAKTFECDTTDQGNVQALFKALDEAKQTPTTVIYNAGYYYRGPITELDSNEVQKTLLTNSFGALLVAQEAAKRMLTAGGGNLLFTGASAGIKGYANSAPFAMGKFALRGLCQSLARELSPQNIHVGHIIIDGLIYSKERGSPYNDPDITLKPAAIANSYLALAEQDKSAWTWEIELRPSVEKF